MPRYIDADALEKRLEHLWNISDDSDFANKEVWHALAEAPTIDVPDRKVGEWDMFDLISSAYYGKRMYFKEDNDIVYSRYSCKYMTVDEALREFISLIDDSVC